MSGARRAPVHDPSQDGRSGLPFFFCLAIGRDCTATCPRRARSANLRSVSSLSFLFNRPRRDVLPDDVHMFTVPPPPEHHDWIDCWSVAFVNKRLDDASMESLGYVGTRGPGCPWEWDAMGRRGRCRTRDEAVVRVSEAILYR